MTRYTNFGYKRKYLEAGFDNDEAQADGDQLREESTVAQASETTATTDPPKKKRKRNRKAKTDNSDPQGAQSGETENDGKEGKGQNRENQIEGHSEPSSTEEKPSNLDKKKRKKEERQRQKAEAKARSERRRLKRIAERHANTTCLACREKGHVAKDCPKAKRGSNIDGQDGSKTSHQKSVVGICYRCGSRRHNLSRCKKAVDPANPLPFASCFVCSGTGHLASACPQNKEKGIYPNGGNCKLCGETTHLAKTCPLRKDDSTKNISASFVGTGGEAGADEDDFHIFKRRKAEVEMEEKQLERAKRMANVKAGVHSGVVKAFGRPAQAGGNAKKVVFFK